MDIDYDKEVLRQKDVHDEVSLEDVKKGEKD